MNPTYPPPNLNKMREMLESVLHAADSAESSKSVFWEDDGALQKFLLGQTADNWLVPIESAWRRTFSPPTAPFNEIVLARKPDGRDLSPSMHPHFIVYVYDNAVFNWTSTASHHVKSLKRMFLSQRENLVPMIKKGMFLSKAVFAAKDGGPDVFVAIVGLDKSVCGGRLSEINEVIDEKVSMEQEKVRVKGEQEQKAGLAVGGGKEEEVSSSSTGVFLGPQQQQQR